MARMIPMLCNISWINMIKKQDENVITLRKVQKILQNALKSKNTFQSFNMEVYEKIFF